MTLIIVRGSDNYLDNVTLKTDAAKSYRHEEEDSSTNRSKDWSMIVKYHCNQRKESSSPREILRKASALSRKTSFVINERRRRYF